MEERQTEEAWSPHGSAAHLQSVASPGLVIHILARDILNDRQTERQTDRQTDRQTKTNRHRQTNRHR